METLLYIVAYRNPNFSYLKERTLRNFRKFLPPVRTFAKQISAFIYIYIFFSTIFAHIREIKFREVQLKYG